MWRWLARQLSRSQQVQSFAKARTVCERCRFWQPVVLPNNPDRGICGAVQNSYGLRDPVDEPLLAFVPLKTCAGEPIVNGLVTHKWFGCVLFCRPQDGRIIRVRPVENSDVETHYP